MKHSVEDISEQIKGRIDAKFPVLLAHLAEELAYDFMFAPKYKITHSYDPPWDCSGMLIRTDESFSMDDYASVEDFFEEYTGQTTASYTSGIGFLHNRFEEKYEDKIREFVSVCYTEVLSEIDDNLLLQHLVESGCDVAGVDKDDIIQTVMDYELFEEPFWYDYEIIERVKPINFKMMVARGKNEAIKKYHDLLEKQREKMERISFEREGAQKLWSKLQKLFRLQKGQPLHKIEMKDYSMFREFLDYNQISMEERIILAEHMGDKFSNKVCMCLKEGK
ncbi:hypothetical protein OIN60_22325 [Paenibacillus sp. P96]|uniref:Uncharacterized protein n=1 Tax=Paenibacillus zeirhizosphaerae TaxID=2987519 RepID=A0ABT9FXJ7_9BACL|nr:hypothetical protein [Paenibacillus sp. P96]MDP4099457.1 hypothetical protein [Paenibacillus sp. P96]